MNNMIITVGTNSISKIAYLKESLKELGIKAELMPIEVDSGISDQPLSELETKRGSINRARNALGKYQTADLSMGIEVGYQLDEAGNYEMLCCATIEDKYGRLVSANSHKLLLPDFHQKVLKDGNDLGDYVHQFLEDYLDLHSQQIGEDIKNRKAFIKTAVKSVLNQYFDISSKKYNTLRCTRRFKH